LVKSKYMRKYDHKKIEKKWQKFWEAKKIYQSGKNKAKRKYYCLVEFPYPSGDGLHVGHIRSYTAMDIVARKRRAEGYSVLYPIGWDAFGLPTENYAVKTGIHPAIVTKRNTDNFRRQLKSLGFSFDWSREINTTDPRYYKWTQWIFLQFFKKGLAYKAKMPINWCLSCKIGLANEEVIDGRCERCGGETDKREKEQWMLAITRYADRLDKDLDKVDYLERIKIQQRNWIGKSEGAEIAFEIVPECPSNSLDSSFSAKVKKVTVFTTRPDTLFGATYMVLAPEHPLVGELLSKDAGTLISNPDEVRNYIKQARRKSEVERTSEGREKSGVELKGVKAVNPANNEKIPVWIADYVIAHYGTGAIMAVPAHDERDFEFAQKHNLPIRMVICPRYPSPARPVLEEAYTGEGYLVDSGEYSGMQSEEAKKAIVKLVKGNPKTTYKLHDWVFSRQRYWGEPIPLVYCVKCRLRAELNGQKMKINDLSEGEKLNPGWIAVPNEDLPVELPNVEKYKPSESGESPLAEIGEWVRTTCPRCGGEARRETDTMPNWAGSSWYYLRYTDPHDEKLFADKEELAYWMPVDWYNGGMEHTTLHLLYSRFWHKFLYDEGLVPMDEPYKKRTSHGLVLAENGEKMSKSKGNVVNPDDIVERFGADTLRVYEMFMGPFDQAISWSTDNLIGSRRFLEKVWRIRMKVKKEKDGFHHKNQKLESLLHQTIKKVGEDIERMHFNTAISALMIYTNELAKEAEVSEKHYHTLLLLLAPFAPYIAEELWQDTHEDAGDAYQSIHSQPWPEYSNDHTEQNAVIIVVQVNGKVRGSFRAQRGLLADKAEKRARFLAATRKWLGGKTVKKIIYVEDRLINFVVD
jgi:leucyl-tRNA synthetase